MKKSDQSGFSAVEALLVVVIAGILGFTGWYVYHAKQVSDKSYSAAGSSTVPTYKKKTSGTPGTKTLDIKQWGVKVGYTTSGDTLSYSIDPTDSNSAIIVSSKLADELGCTDQGGGYIYRLKPTDKVPGYPDESAAPTVQSDLQKNASSYGHVGNYYYSYGYEYQSACSDKQARKDPLGKIMKQEENFVASLVPKFVAD